MDLLALIGFATRDRSVALALLLYIPLLPLGLASIGLDLGLRGRALVAPRFLLTVVGLIAVVCSGLTMIGRGPESFTTAEGLAGEAVTLLHWNTLWGGLPRTDASWASIEADILERNPDIVVLNEAPLEPRLDSLEKRLGTAWSSCRVEHGPGSPYWYKLAALSRWPVRKGGMIPVRNGTAVNMTVERPGRPLRLLVVDGQSRVTQLRTPFLLDVASACERARREGNPFDLVVGDFNAVGRSLGFDALQSAADGFTLASHSSTGWRGTWPMPVPVYDIDHVWVRDGLATLSCSLFANAACDHRGQLVRLRLPVFVSIEDRIETRNVPLNIAEGMIVGRQ
jgi:endonuclease/exonuclease/phosphatase family metal-dependent hydrolase